MKTLYAACLSRLGLSLGDATALHGVRPDTVKSWSAGRTAVPAGVWRDLRDYEARIVDRSEAIREAWEDAGEIREIDAAVADDAGLMALADFVLSNAALPAIDVTVRNR